MPGLKYEQIAESLRARITEGEFGPGDLLPSGRELAEEWGVSRATVVKAMDVLRNDGVAIARQGSGFAVVERPLARPAGRRKPGGARIAGAAAYRLLGTPVKEVPPACVATALGLTDGGHVLRRTRLMLLDDGSPASLVDAWFPPSVSTRCPRLAAPEPLAEGTTRYVARRTGRSPVAGNDLTRARLATEDEAEVLGLELPTAVVVVLHSARDATGVALVCEVGVTPAELWEDEADYPMGS